MTLLVGVVEVVVQECSRDCVVVFETVEARLVKYPLSTTKEIKLFVG